MDLLRTMEAGLNNLKRNFHFITLINMYTIQFSATCGVNSGYGHGNENRDAAATVASVWQQKAAEYFAANGLYVGAVVSPALTVYHTDWGCPQGGEATASIIGVANPEFTKIEDYKAAVIAVLGEVSKELGQTTAQVAFAECAFHYQKNG